MKLYEEPEYHEKWQAHIIAREAGFYWLSMPMMFNDRLVCVENLDDTTWWYGWCFQKGAALITAALVFDPQVQDEPVGWHKRPGLIRKAPDRDKDPEYNRPRCIHGTYLHASKCGIVMVCPEFPFPGRS